MNPHSPVSWCQLVVEHRDGTIVIRFICKKKNGYKLAWWGNALRRLRQLEALSDWGPVLVGQSWTWLSHGQAAFGFQADRGDPAACQAGPGGVRCRTPWQPETRSRGVIAFGHGLSRENANYTRKTLTAGGPARCHGHGVTDWHGRDSDWVVTQSWFYLNKNRLSGCRSFWFDRMRPCNWAFFGHIGISLV